MSPLERRYRVLVSLFPAAHRARWEDDLVATLLDAAPEGRAFPTPREALDLTLAAARAHAQEPARRPFAEVLRGGVLLGVFLLAALRLGAALRWARGAVGYVVHLDATHDVGRLHRAGLRCAESLFLAMFVVALFSARRAPALAATLLLALSYGAPDRLHIDLGHALVSVLPLVLAAGLVRPQPVLPRPALAILLPPLVVLGAYPMVWLYRVLDGGLITPSAPVISLGVGASLIAAALLRVLDARWLIVPAVYFGEDYLYEITRRLRGDGLFASSTLAGMIVFWVPVAFFVGCAWAHWRLQRRSSPSPTADA
ncbi:hypothetical protein A7982_13902 [Minicystis rosea]|nr:hypothetical protein A7982_13902 [Minicystis rosea]